MGRVRKGTKQRWYLRHEVGRSSPSRAAASSKRNPALADHARRCYAFGVVHSRDLPSGTVTFLFTDIEGSTRLLHEMGEAYVPAFAEHRRILRETFARHSGVEVGTGGDAFFVVFRLATQAVEAAAEAQAALRPGRIWVRMGLHTGEPFISEGDYVGLDVHKAARIAASGHGGQVVLSAETQELLGDDVPLVDLGEYKLKDFDEPVQLFQLGEGRFPPLRTAPTLPFPGRRPPVFPGSARYPKSSD